jgi:ATP-dependent RNA helicase RhlE
MDRRSKGAHRSEKLRPFKRRSSHHRPHTQSSVPTQARHSGPLPPFTPFSEGVFSKLIEPLQRALRKENYSTPTPIQEQSIPPVLEGRDLFGIAQTGTGKTAAFTLPLLQHLAQKKIMPGRGRPRALILAPTRELAAQIGDSITAYGYYLHLTHTVIYGGVGQRPQTDALARGMDIVVATPGRLMDLMEQGHVQLDKIEVFILDEADRMFDMGFIIDIKKIAATIPKHRQTLFFSATMAEKIRKLASEMVHNPAQVTIMPEKPTVERINQKVMFVEKKDKDLLLIKLLQHQHKTIVFTQMKHAANKVVERLEKAGINAAAIHGNKTQSARQEALDRFKKGKIDVLVATDIAARGIDVDNITHVVNYDLPNEAETYVHRIGRTARAGAKGDAISFCSSEERAFLRDIERLIKMQIPVDKEHQFHSEAAVRSMAAKPVFGRQQRPQRSGARPQGRPFRRR